MDLGAPAAGSPRGSPPEAATRRLRLHAPVPRRAPLPARGHPGQGGPDEHAALAREPRAAARPRAHGVRGAMPARSSCATGRQVHPEGGHAGAPARRDPQPARRWASGCRWPAGSAASCATSRATCCTDPRARQRGIIRPEAVARLLATHSRAARPLGPALVAHLLRAVVPRHGGTVSARPLVVHVVNSLAVGGLENGVVNLVNNATDRFRHVIVCMTSAGALRDAASSPRSRSSCWASGRARIPGRLRCGSCALLRRLRPAIVHSPELGRVRRDPGGPARRRSRRRPRRARPGDRAIRRGGTLGATGSVARWLRW